LTLSCEIRSKDFGEGIKGRRQTAPTAHRLGPKDNKNVGAKLRDIRIQIYPSQQFFTQRGADRAK
jgi:hypothetical protein